MGILCVGALGTSSADPGLVAGAVEEDTLSCRVPYSSISLKSAFSQMSRIQASHGGINVTAVNDMVQALPEFPYSTSRQALCLTIRNGTRLDVSADPGLFAGAVEKDSTNYRRSGGRTS